MEKKCIVRNYERIMGTSGVNINPIMSSNRLENVKLYFDNNIILGKELPIILNENETTKQNKKGPREYYVFEDAESHQAWQGGHMNECYFNEYARGKDDVRLCFDYDVNKTDKVLFEWDDDSLLDAISAIESLMDNICIVIDPDYEIKYEICKCEKPDKLSLHIIFLDVSIKFKLIPNVIKNLIPTIKLSDEDKKYIYKPDVSGEMSSETWFDTNIYPTTDEAQKSLRLVGHKKRCDDIAIWRHTKKSDNPSELYIRHRSELEYEIKEVGDYLICNRKVICDLDRKYIPTIKQKKVSNSVDPSQLGEILEHLSDYRRKYECRIKVMFAIYNTFGEEGKDLYVDFMINGERDRGRKAESDWAGIKDNERESKCTLGTIFYFLKEDDEDFYNEIRTKIRPSAIKLFHDIGFMDITFDTLYEYISSREYEIDEYDEDTTKHKNELKDDMSNILYQIKSCIAMFKTPKTYYRVKRVCRKSSGLEVYYQNTDKLDSNLYINVKKKCKIGEELDFQKEYVYIESLIGQGTKLGMMYNMITFYPSTELTKDLNTFTGFIGSIKQPNSDNIDFTPILDHTKFVICKGNDEHYNYFMNWLTHIFQSPHKKTDVVPVLVGEQGVGKSILFEKFIVPFVMGVQYSKTVDSIETVLEKHFNLSETLLLIFEEALFAGHKKEANTLKHKITGKQTIVNEKFKDIREVESFLNMCIISNHDHCIPLEIGDRRYFPLKCDDMRKGDLTYFDKMTELFNPQTGHAFYNYLMSRKLEPIRTPPMTALKQEIINMSKDKISLFIDEVDKGEIENVETKIINNINHYIFTAEDLLRRIGDSYLTKPKMKTILIKHGWVYNKITLDTFMTKGQYWRYYYPVKHNDEIDVKSQ